MPQFEGRTIVITGAAGGLGSAVTQAFLQAGADVIGVSRQPPQTSPAAHLTWAEADLAAPGEAERVVRRADRVDALVHLVGGFAGGQQLAETDDATWNLMLQMNLMAAFRTLRAVLPGMLAAGRGRIVAIGSRTGMEPAAGLSAYGASKAALIHLIRTVALEISGRGVTANIVLPAVIDTAANRAANPGADYSRWVRPESIAHLVLWLASDESRDVNGAAIPIYGA